MYIYQKARRNFRFHECLRFIGESNIVTNEGRVQIPAASAIDLRNFSNNFSVSLWVRLTWRTQRTSSLRNYGVLAWGLNTNFAEASLTLDFVENLTNSTTTAAAGRWIMRYRAAGGGIAEISSGEVAAGAAFGQWHHLVLLRNTAAGTIQLWDNGVLLAQATGIGGNTDIFGTNNYLGRGQYNTTLQGHMDSVTFFNTALSQSQIQGLYNSGNGTFPPSSLFENVTGYWDFDQPEGTTLINKVSVFNQTHASGNGTLQYWDAERTQLSGGAWVDHSTLQPPDFYLSEYSETSRLFVDGVNDAINRTGLVTGVRTVEMIVQPQRTVPQFFTENVTGSSWTGVERHRFVLAPVSYTVNGAAPPEADIGFSVGTNGVNVHFHRGAAYFSCPISHPVAIPDTQETHLAVAISADNRALLYINGAFVKQSAVLPHPVSSNNTNLGAYGGFNNLQWKGWLKNFRVWSTERTAQEIFDNRSAHLATGTGLMMSVPMSRTSATQTTLTDQSGNARNMAMSKYILSI